MGLAHGIWAWVGVGVGGGGNLVNNQGSFGGLQFRLATGEGGGGAGLGPTHSEISLHFNLQIC